MTYSINTRRIIRDIATLALLAFGLVMVGGANAQEMKARSLTPHKTFELLLNDKNVLFVDVRDPIEIMFTGSANATHVNIPYLFADKNQWDEKYSRFVMKRNPEFIAQISKALEERGLDFTSTIVTICRSGSERGLPSAQFLIDSGYTNAFYVDHGFQGDAIKEGANKGMRLVNGWQNSGLPWTSKLDGEVIFRNK
ncbi:MAG: rhodanese-like domain-containing protein [Limnobacter sp.]|nr:rhodanese-like domain-containing protein [Limnobacter sp.]